MMRYLNYALLCTVLWQGLLVAPAWAADGSLRTTINRVLVANPDRFGGCMALLADDPQEVLPNCRNNWVSFSCSGDFNAKDVGYRKLDQAQLAFALDRTVQVHITDSQRHNGFCFVTRIDLLR